MSEPSNDYDRLIRPIERRMMQTVWRITRDAEDAQDAFQDALARIWDKRDIIRDHANPTALILRMCSNAAFDTLRRRSRRNRHECGDALLESQGDKTLRADRRMELEESREQILQAIGSLPDQQQAAVTLRLLHEVPYAEIAQALECTETTARTHYARALQQLRRILPQLDPTQPAPTPEKEVAP